MPIVSDFPVLKLRPIALRVYLCLRTIFIIFSFVSALNIPLLLSTFETVAVEQLASFAIDFIEMFILSMKINIGATRFADWF